MQAKTTRAFRTISEAAEELDLQPHVLRFWESKFPNFKPIKRGGGRRFYRPDDIEFLRGIKVLLHDERHPIKDVQKLIRVKGVGRIVELGRSVEKAAIPKSVKDTVLVPERIRTVEFSDEIQNPADTGTPELEAPEAEVALAEIPAPVTPVINPETSDAEPTPRISTEERHDLELALDRLKNLRNRWQEFQQDLTNN